MSLTRSFLNGMGLTADQVSAIIEAHTDTVDALKAQRDSYKGDADKIAELESELAKANKKIEGFNADDSWKEKYEAERKAFETYKSEQAEAQKLEIKAKSYKDALRNAGVSDKAIEIIMDSAKAKDVINALELDDAGSVKGLDEITTAIKTDYAGFITSADTQGADTQTPPRTDGGSVSAEQFAKMGYNERAKLFNENRELYDTLSKGE